MTIAVSATTMSTAAPLSTSSRVLDRLDCICHHYERMRAGVGFIVAAVLSLTAAATRPPAALLDDAERLRATDKARSRQLLTQAESAIAAHPDPLLVGRAQLLECTWAQESQAAYRAVAIGLPAAERAGSVDLRAKLIACRALALTNDSKDAEAEADYRTAMALARQANDAALEAATLRDLGELQYTRGAMADALTNLQTAYKLLAAHGDERGRLDALSLIANVYADAHVAQYDRALEYYRQVLAAYERDGMQSDVADTVFNIGSTLQTKGDFAAAEVQYGRALEMFEKLHQPGDVAYTRRAMAIALMNEGRAAEALPQADAALAYYAEKNNAYDSAVARQYRGMILRRLGRLPEALRDLDSARRYFETQKNTRFLERNEEEVALTYAQAGDWRNAYDAATRHAALQQQLADSRRDELSSRLRIAFDVEKTEQENRALARESSLRATALREAQRSQRLQIVVIALTALLAAALAVLFWRQVVNTRRMRAMALTDELTRLPNRRHILAAVDIAFAAAKREHRPTAVLIFDIDHFKRINDTYGHAAGDQVLQRIARTCRMELRADDQLGRVGGEEFLALLSAATGEQARDVAERLRAAVERTDFSSIAPSLRVTISIGVSVANEYEPRTAIATADSLLYRAKEAGRNRVEIATSSPPRLS
jgi:diguanylate cyclase (GGDEF)-like protein